MLTVLAKSSKLMKHQRCREPAYAGAVRHYATRLEADLAHPDSTFVEDTAVLTPHGAMLTRPGAASRLDEVTAIAGAVRGFYPMAAEITARFHDAGAAARAQAEFLALSQKVLPKDLPEIVSAQTGLTANLVSTGLASSGSDARRKIEKIAASRKPSMA